MPNARQHLNVLYVVYVALRAAAVVPLTDSRISEYENGDRLLAGRIESGHRRGEGETSLLRSASSMDSGRVSEITPRDRSGPLSALLGRAVRADPLLSSPLLSPPPAAVSGSQGRHATHNSDDTRERTLRRISDSQCSGCVNEETSLGGDLCGDGCRKIACA